MTIEPVTFEGHAGVRVRDGAACLTVTTSTGPRVLELSAGGRNLMAVLPDSTLDRSGRGAPFRFLGGHRLWAAPEVPEVTYEPDDRPCALTEVDGGVRVEAPPDGAGLAKTLEVRPDADGWIVDHTIRNASRAVVRLAPWAITQLRLGGEVDLPTGSSGPGPQADRCVVLWPYTDPSDPRIRFAPGAVAIDAEPGPPRIKLGVAPSAGTVRYRLEGEIFEKRVEIEPGAAYPDRGAAIQVYLCDEFCELETLGPLRDVEPGDAVTHRERWTLRTGEARPGTEEP
ncbi:MAG TPA: hypothetical protein VID69_08455 [Actinomycetota bacterium]